MPTAPNQASPPGGTCFGALAELLSGRPGPLVVGQAATGHGLPELHGGYAQILGTAIERPTG